jgi:hypothetical protein
MVYAQREDNSRPEGLRIVQTTITSAPEDGTPGTYLLEGLEPGQAYNIVFIKNGYEVRAIRVNAPAVEVYSGNDVTLYPAVYHRLDGLVQLEPFQAGASIDIRLVRNVPPDNLRVIVLHQHPSPRQPGNEGPVRYEFEVPAARYDFYWSAQGYDWVRDTFDITGNGPLPFVVLEGQ